MNFDPIAPWYDWLASAVFGQSLKRAQSQFLHRIPAGASILIVGGGTGWLLEPLLTGNRPGRVVYLERSARMLARASNRMLRRSLPGAVTFRLGTETTLLPTDRFDVIITAFVLDVHSALTLKTALLPRLRLVLKPGGQWFITDFVSGGNWGQRGLIWAMIWFFRLTARIEIRRLANWQPLMVETALHLSARQSHLRGLVSTEVWTND